MSPIYQQGDASEMPYADNFFNCIITSPPYNIGMDYAGVDDSMEWNEYGRLVDQWAAEMHRVVQTAGRVWVNVPPTLPFLTPEGKPEPDGSRMNVGALWYEALYAAGLTYRDTTVWVQGDMDSGAAWGSYLSPNANNQRGGYEIILCFFKNQWNQGRKEQNDVPKDRWMELARNVWTFKSASAKRVGHPAPFPEELPRRCLWLSTWPGDKVLDPFVGSGTTCRVAEEMGRLSWGLDKSQEYIDQRQAEDNAGHPPSEW